MLAEVLPPGAPIAVLSGPSFAQEVYERQPTAVDHAQPEELLPRRAPLAAELEPGVVRPGEREHGDHAGGPFHAPGQEQPEDAVEQDGGAEHEGRVDGDGEEAGAQAGGLEPDLHVLGGEDGVAALVVHRGASRPKRPSGRKR